MQQNLFVEAVNKNDEKSIRTIILKSRCDNFPLHCSANNKNLGIVKIILDAFPEAAAKKDGGGLFPLHIAVSNENPEVVKIILDAHPQAAAGKDNMGSSPLHYAAGHNANPDVIRMILDAYPQAAAKKDKYGSRPVDYATHNPNKEVEKLLLRATLRFIRRPLSAKIIQRAWRECRYNPEYKMCERVFEKNIEDTVMNYLPSNK